MSGRINGGRTRMLDLEAARRTSRRLKPSTLTPDEASILIDSVFMQYGMDPTLWTDFSGWRHIMIGSAEGFAGVVEWQPDDHYLVVLAPVLDIPDESEQLTEFYKMLLELNYHGTLSAHFSIYEDTLYLGVTRPIRSLDEEEVNEAIRTVMVLADSYDDRLKELINILPPSLPELPDIKMRPKDAQIIGLTLAACDPYGQEIFRYLMEQWESLGHIVDVGTRGVALCFLIEDQPYAVAALHPGFAERRQEVILSWEGLRRKTEFSAQVIRNFQSEVLTISEVRTTANTGHLEITESFNLEKAHALIQAMEKFVQSAVHKQDSMEQLAWSTEIPKLEISTSPSTTARIYKTLHACNPQIRQIYIDLIQGWDKAGGIVESDSPGRIDLKLKTGEHEYGRYGVLSHYFNLAVLTAPKEDQDPRIELAWDLASGQYAYLDYAAQEVKRFEAILSHLPGFSDKGSFTSIILDESFHEEHTLELLNALVELKSAAGD